MKGTLLWKNFSRPGGKKHFWFPLMAAVDPAGNYCHPGNFFTPKGMTGKDKSQRTWAVSAYE
jgi:hypothetical protein